MDLLGRFSSGKVVSSSLRMRYREPQPILLPDPKRRIVVTQQEAASQVTEVDYSRVGIRFCGGCGQSVEHVDRFCGGCGSPLVR